MFVCALKTCKKAAKTYMFPTLTNGKIMKNEHLFKTHFSKLFLKWTNNCKKRLMGSFKETKYEMASF